MIYKDPRNSSNAVIGVKNGNKDFSKVSINNVSVNTNGKSNLMSKKKTTISEKASVSIHTQNVNTEKSTNTINTKGLKSLHLNQAEKETFFSLLGFAHANFNFIRPFPIISVESLYGIFIFIKK